MNLCWLNAEIVPTNAERTPQPSKISWILIVFKHKIHLIKKKVRDNLGTIEKIIVELKGEPSYTSGAQR